MPNYVASRVAGILNDIGRAVHGSRIFILGITYKPDVADVRESPSLMAMQALHRKGAHVSFHDPFIEEVTVNGDSIGRTDLGEGIAGADLVLLLTPHSEYNLGGSRIERH